MGARTGGPRDPARRGRSRVVDLQPVKSGDARPEFAPWQYTGGARTFDTELVLVRPFWGSSSARARPVVDSRRLGVVGHEHAREAVSGTLFGGAQSTRQRRLDDRGVPRWVASHPYTIRDDIAALWMKALAVASDPATVWPVLGHAASLCRLLATETDYDNRRGLCAVEVASASITAFPFAHDLLLAARKVVRDEAVLVQADKEGR